MQEKPSTYSESVAEAEYTRRLTDRQTTAERLAEQSLRISNLRLLVFALGLGLLWAVWGKEGFWGWGMVVPIAVFIGLLFRHEQVITAEQKARRSSTFYLQGLHRLEDTWAGKGFAGERFLDPAHPYSADLDIFGVGSLFERLCTARTRAGEECLARWLLAPASPETVLARQEAVVALAPRLDFREALALLGEETRSALHPDALIAWGEEPPLAFAPWHRQAARMLAAGGVLTLLVGITGNGWIPFLVAVGLGQALEYSLRKPVKRVIRDVDRPASDLALLSELLRCVETERFEAKRLCDLQASLQLAGHPPSERIARLESTCDYLRWMYNQFFAPIGLLLLWRTQCAFAIEAWRVQNGPHLAPWLAVIGEFEALHALASYAYERPHDPFPTFASEGGPLFEAVDLTHPLLPESQAVANGVRLDAETRLWIVSGSNMSGKSTLLRAVGVNAVLAQAGAPVRATRLTLTPCTVGASLRTLDSLQGGVSRFYAEITRLRQVVDIAREHPPALFLLDEILHGTNSHDRRIGAEAIAKALVQSGAFGLITTHDLALTQIVSDSTLHAANVHFQDTLEAGKMHFDYHLRPGIVTKSNALELMRAVGLPV